MNDKAKAEAIRVGSECLGYRTRLSNRAISRIYDRHLQAAGFKGPQFTLMGVIIAKEKISAASLTKILDMEKSTASRNLKRLMDKKWITTAETNPGREELLSATGKGRRAFVKAMPLWEAAQTEVSRLVGSEGKDHIHGIFEKIRK